MNRHPQLSRFGLNRRTAIGWVGAAAAALSLGRLDRAAAQEEGGDLAGHPLTGAWTVMTPDGVAQQIFGPDGSTVAALPPSYVDPMLGLVFQGTLLGRWEAVDERQGHFTVIQSLSDADGAYVGTIQFEAHPEVSADGQTFVAGTPQRVIVRDAANTVTFDQVVTMDPPVTATRMGAAMESVVLPATPAASTPVP